MFYFVGLGLGDASDITVKGLDIVKKSKRVYLEAYTSILTVGKEALETFYGRELILADRDMVEQCSDELLADAEIDDIALLVVGDPLGATTHSDLIIRAVKKNIKYKVIHNASIMNAIGCCGLQLYNFGETVSIVFWEETWRPESFYDKICINKKQGMHTLCLLDIKMKEQTIENLMKGKKTYEPPRFMTVAQACQQLMEIILKKQEEGEELCLRDDTVCIGVARVGSDEQQIIAATLKQLTAVDMGAPLHSLVVPGKTHPIETDLLRHFASDDSVKALLQHL